MVANYREIQNTFSKNQKIKQFLEREALNVRHLWKKKSLNLTASNPFMTLSGRSLHQVTIFNLVALRVFNNYCQQKIVYFFECFFILLCNVN